jgi:hypothetical protein
MAVDLVVMVAGAGSRLGGLKQYRVPVGFKHEAHRTLSPRRR